MNELKCTNCGEAHTSNDRHCSFCGEDLGEVILKYKEKQLPVTFNNDKPKKIQPKDEAEERRQAILRIKEQQNEQKREQKRVAKQEEQQRREEYLSTIKVRKIPSRKTKRLTFIPPAVMLLGIIVAVALLNTDIYGQDTDAFGPFFIVLIILGTLFLLSFIPSLMVNSLIRTKGQKLCYTKPSQEEKDKATKCDEFCASGCWI